MANLVSLVEAISLGEAAEHPPTTDEMMRTFEQWATDDTPLCWATIATLGNIPLSKLSKEQENELLFRVSTLSPALLERAQRKAQAVGDLLKKAQASRSV